MASLKNSQKTVPIEYDFKSCENEESLTITIVNMNYAGFVGATVYVSLAHIKI